MGAKADGRRKTSKDIKEERVPTGGEREAHGSQILLSPKSHILLLKCESTSTFMFFRSVAKCERRERKRQQKERRYSEREREIQRERERDNNFTCNNFIPL